MDNSKFRLVGLYMRAEALSPFNPRRWLRLHECARLPPHPTPPHPRQPPPHQAQGMQSDGFAEPAHELDQILKAFVVEFEFLAAAWMWRAHSAPGIDLLRGGRCFPCREFASCLLGAVPGKKNKKQTEQ